MRTFIFIICVIGLGIGAFGVCVNLFSGPPRNLNAGEFFCSSCDKIILADETRSESRGDRTVRVCVICGSNTSWYESLIIYGFVTAAFGYGVFSFVRMFLKREETSYYHLVTLVQRHFKLERNIQNLLEANFSSSLI